MLTNNMTSQRNELIGVINNRTDHLKRGGKSCQIIIIFYPFANGKYEKKIGESI